LEDNTITMEELDRLRFLLRESVPVVARLQTRLHPFSSYVVLPVFALANAGITFEDGVLAEALHSRVTLGVVAGLLLGKVTGITLATWLAVRSGLGRLPTATTWPVMVGLGMVGGIGFTVALFITGLSFPGAEHLVADAKAGVMGASVLAAVMGLAYLMVVTRTREHSGAPAADRGSAPVSPSP
jgi:NhaA family Na+:H+ antiporter